MEYCGKNFLIQKLDATNYVTIGGMRSNSMTINNEQVDVTTKGTMSWRQLKDCGVRSMTISGEGVFTDNSVLNDVQESAITDGSTIAEFKLISDHGDEFAGEFLIASFERTGDYNNSETFSMTLESAGEITYTAA